MTGEPSDIWRARALADDGTEREWRGRWRTLEAATAQARRWCEDMAMVWLECRDGMGLTVLQNDAGYGEPGPYDPVSNT